ncbi:MAG: hypothetical protein C0490_01520, partial [Marivirga sp.]|nr:hypothetical protein [Marivirga sp.]
MKTLPDARSAVIVFFLFSFSCFSQDIKWHTFPRKGFVFQISNREAQNLLTLSTPDTIFNGLLHTMIDTFDVEKGWNDRPGKGHFILARIIENKLHCQYTSVFPYQVFLLKEYDALSLQVLDLNGNVREDAKVKFRLKRLKPDPQSRTYRLENDWVQGGERFVTVELDGFRSVFNIEKHEVPSWYEDYHNDDGPAFYSYMLTDKNKYKPNDKVRFKSYALSGARTPLRRDLEVWLINGNKSIKVGLVSPHRPGSFTGEFQLHDSLNLTLDRPYTLELIEKRGRLVSSCNFKYEDYELTGNKLDVQLKTVTQYHPVKNSIAITATDVNGLLLKDARATVVVKAQTIRETFQPLVILPDTLLIAEMDLNPDSATVVDIPSVLFQKTNTAYQVHVSILNSQNQRMEMVVNASHYYSQYELISRFSNDSIVYELLNNGLSMRNVPMKLRHNNEVTSLEILLPYKEKLNPVVSTVRLEGGLASREIQMRSLIPNLELKGGIEKDSFNIRLHNPQQLEVSWYIYQGSILLEKGSGKGLEYNSLIEDRTHTFYVELLYAFGGEEQIKRNEYEFKEGSLNVSLSLPERVYPGQQVEAAITVTDQSGGPVAGVDLTAMAVTTKLHYYLPDLPYYGSNSMPRSRKAHYSKHEINKRLAILDLDYKRWGKLARLDTMKYYRFIYPDRSPFRHTVEIYDSTQFAPYVMQAGEAKEIYVIEVDRRPAYYSWVDQPKNYSFHVSPGRMHEISLRLFDRVLVLDSMSFEPCKKTILSIDLDNLPKDVKVYKMYTAGKRRSRKPKVLPTFTKTEIDRHMQYVSSFRNAEGNAFLESASQFTPLFSAQFPARKEMITAGP